MKIKFITAAMAMEIHRDQIERYGGSMEIRDVGLLESALAMPAAEFSGEYLHEFPHGMAAAYLYHLGKNHAFVDGNKRLALASMLVFLKLNKIFFEFDHSDLEQLVLNTMTGKIDKSELATIIKSRLVDRN